MKKWIKKLDDKSIETILKDYDLIDKTSITTDQKILHMIKEGIDTSKESLYTKKPYFKDLFIWKPLYSSLAMSIIILLILIPAIFIFYKTSLNNNITISTNIKGYVDRINDNNAINFKIGQKIEYKDIIAVNDDSSCQIQIGDNSTIFVNENSRIQFNELLGKSNKTKITLVNGKIMVSIEKKLKNGFEIETDQAYLYITGTKFIVESYPDNYTYIALSDGKLKVKNKYNQADTMYLNKDEAIIIKKDQLLKQRITEEEKLSLNNLKILNLMGINDLIKKEKNNKNQILWTSKRIYKYNYSYNISKNKILSFDSNEKYVVAQTEVSTICFDLKGKLVWENTFGEKDGLFFMTIPVIYKNKIYLSSLNKKLVVLDLVDGKILKVINTIGNTAFGYKSVVYKDYLYLPYSDGIYTVDLNKYSLSSKPVINFNNPTTPLIIKDRIYLASFVEKNISSYDLTGKIIWKYNMSSNSFNSPIQINDYIFIADNAGTIYKFTLDGRLEQKIKIDQKITSNLNGDINNIFALTNDGLLYKVSCNNLKSTKLFKVDVKPDISDYLFKSPLIYNNKVLIGTNDGKIIIYNTENDRYEINRELSSSSITTKVFKFNDYFYVGTNTGEIFLLKRLD